jgi:aromatic-L-amino-acid/L-tryptophan decarboxylase
VEGLRERIRGHCALARWLADRIEEHPGFELAAPVPFSAVCFRAVVSGSQEEQNHLNERLLARVNAAGPFFLSPTTLRGRYTPRVAIGNIRTGRQHIEALWELLSAERP